ncbi:MAG: AmmeMemoRadiSam system radical SAM enzyme, partial [Pseudomonadales bacterium]|nr:AmmeMemoRadiSam system radical SAM enzyme [Pseudomonadales bacterium]
ACKFCQNWDMSKSRHMDTLADRASPGDLAATAKRMNCQSVAFTYNDPVIFLEYAVDTAQACREQGIKSVAVSAGFINEAPRERFFSNIDAANIDLKAFSEEFYYELCGGHLHNVLETLQYIKQETDVWLEITTLLIPGRNDSDSELDAMTGWIRDRLGTDVPLHFTAFHPDWKMRDIGPTPHSTLIRARQIAIANGLHYVYTGNVHDRDGSSTWCPGCKHLVIERDWYELGEWHLDGAGRCENCGTGIAGHFAARPGDWGARRVPVRISADHL